jgi:hypothetical protein
MQRIIRTTVLLVALAMIVVFSSGCDTIKSVANIDAPTATPAASQPAPGATVTNGQGTPVPAANATAQAAAAATSAAAQAPQTIPCPLPTGVVQMNPTQCASQLQAAAQAAGQAAAATAVAAAIPPTPAIVQPAPAATRPILVNPQAPAGLQATPVVVNPQPTAGQPAPVGPRSRVIPITEAQSWCPAGCSADRFAPLEAYGNNPDDVGIKLKPGSCVTIDLPAGYYGQSWDGFKAVTVEGPMQVKTCEASFRKQG